VRLIVPASLESDIQDETKNWPIPRHITEIVLPIPHGPDCPYQVAAQPVFLLFTSYLMLSPSAVLDGLLLLIGGRRTENVNSSPGCCLNPS
jgi:hypothetical protein